MRIAGLAALIVFLCLPGFAQAAGVAFGTARCAVSAPCNTALSSDKTVPDMQSCSLNHFGPTGYSFDPNAPIGSNGCLEAEPSTSRGSGTALAMVPHCCVVQDGSSCHIECQLIGTR